MPETCTCTCGLRAGTIEDRACGLDCPRASKGPAPESRQVFVACRLVDDGESFEINGVFSTRDGAAAVCTTENDSFVAFTVDVDCTDERTFAITHPVTSMEERVVTA